MKKTRAITAIALAAIMLAASFGFSAAAEDGAVITVSLRIEGLSENLYYNRAIELPAETEVTAEQLLTAAESDGAPEILLSDEGAIEEIDGVGESGGAVWNVRINGSGRDVPVSECTLSDGDEVVIFYADTEAVGMQYPEADVSSFLADGIIRFTSEDIGSEVTVSHVADAVVTRDGVTSVTNHRGEIFAEPGERIAGVHTLQIERYDAESGLPTVLRFSPDYKVFVPFTDTVSGSWYIAAVRFAVEAEFFKGVGDNKFAPQEKMTIEQLITVLARIAGHDTQSGDTDVWYSASLEWAVGNGLISGDEFEAGTNVTRETFIYMFYLTAGLSENNDMGLRADITVAVDYDGISQDYLDAVSWAVASGLIRGTDGDKLTIDPQTEISRSVVCQMLLNYYQ